MQNTGNPVLDSFVNLAANGHGGLSGNESLKELHALVVELAQKEPGGLADGRPIQIGKLA